MHPVSHDRRATPRLPLPGLDAQLIAFARGTDRPCLHRSVPILDASPTGLRLVCPDPLRAGTELLLRLASGQTVADSNLPSAHAATETPSKSKPDAPIRFGIVRHCILQDNGQNHLGVELLVTPAFVADRSWADWLELTAAVAHAPADAA